MTGLEPKVEYRFRVRAFSEYSQSLDKYSHYSEITQYYAAALPEKIEWPATSAEIFTDV